MKEVESTRCNVSTVFQRAAISTKTQPALASHGPSRASHGPSSTMESARPASAVCRGARKSPLHLQALDEQYLEHFALVTVAPPRRVVTNGQCS